MMGVVNARVSLCDSLVIAASKPGRSCACPFPDHGHRRAGKPSRPLLTPAGSASGEDSSRSGVWQTGLEALVQDLEQVTWLSLCTSPINGDNNVTQVDAQWQGLH